MEKTWIGLGLFAVAGAMVFNTVYQPAHAQSSGAAAKCELVNGVTAGKRVEDNLPLTIDAHKRRGAEHVQVHTIGELGLFVCSY